MIGTPMRPCWSHLAWIVACVGESPSWLFCASLLCGDGSGTFESYLEVPVRSEVSSCHSHSFTQRVTAKNNTRWISSDLELRTSPIFKNAETSVILYAVCVGIHRDNIIAGELNERGGAIADEGWPPWRWSGRVTGHNQILI